MPSLRSQSNESRLQKPQRNDDAGRPYGSSSPIGGSGGLDSTLGKLAGSQGVLLHEPGGPLRIEQELRDGIRRQRGRRYSSPLVELTGRPSAMDHDSRTRPAASAEGLADGAWSAAACRRNRLRPRSQ
jgi:hypothetical protein